MVYIITKNDGPRKEDVAAKKFIESNRTTIDRLANHLSGGRWQDIKKARHAQVPVVEQDRRSFSGYTPVGRAESSRPYIRISLNNRVVVADEETSRQVLFLGEMRRGAAGRVFRLATRENGFFAPLTYEILELLAGLDGLVLGEDDAEEPFKRELAARLGFGAMDGA
ncbi:MAG TPA: hypothetical protein VIQ29_25630 [Ancylobacter sp.]